MRIAVMIISFVVAASAAIAQDNPLAIYFKPQQMVTLPSGQRINLICTGEGGPVVVLLGGLGLTTEVWGRAQPLIAKTHKTCAFDPPGYRFSDLGPLPITAERTADALHGAMKAGGLKPPFVLVAHSRAGFDVRQFAHRYPGETAGLVLLDVNAGLTAAPASTSSDWGQEDSTMECIRVAAQKRLTPDTPLFKRCGSPAPGSNALNANMAQAFLSQNDNLEGDAAAVSRIHSYESIPMIVLTAGDYSEKWRGDIAQQKASEEAHAALAAQSRKGLHSVVPDAGHMIMFDKPEAVAEGVEDVIAMIRWD